MFSRLKIALAVEMGSEELEAEAWCQGGVASGVLL
jgi:hypothetical protein